MISIMPARAALAILAETDSVSETESVFPLSVERRRRLK